MSQSKQNREIDFEEDDEGEICNVDYIITDKVINGKLYYLIKWEDYSSKYNSWEPEENINHLQEVIEEYDEKKERRAMRMSQKSKKYENMQDFDEEEISKDSFSSQQKLTKRQLKIKENRAREEEKRNNEQRRRSGEVSKHRQNKKGIHRREASNLIDFIEDFQNNCPCIEITFNKETRYQFAIGDYQDQLKQEEKEQKELQKQRQIEKNQKEKQKQKDKEKQQQKLQKQQKITLNYPQKAQQDSQEMNQQKLKQSKDDPQRQKRTYTKRQTPVKPGQYNFQLQQSPGKCNQEIKDLRDKLEQLEQNKISEDMLLSSLYNNEEPKLQQQKNIEKKLIKKNPELPQQQIQRNQQQQLQKSQQQGYQQSTQNQVNLQQIYQFGTPLGPGMPFQPFPGQFQPIQFAPMGAMPPNMPPFDKSQQNAQNKPMSNQIIGFGQPMPMIGSIWPPAMLQQFPPQHNQQQQQELNKKQPDKMQQAQQQGQPFFGNPQFSQFPNELFGIPGMQKFFEQQQPMQQQQQQMAYQQQQQQQRNQKQFDPNSQQFQFF